MSGPVSLAQAAALVPDGALVTLGGFQLNRAPMALVFELLRQGRTGLRVVGPPNPLPLDLMVGAGAAAEIEFGFIGFQFEDGFVVAPHVRRAIEQGSIRWRERDVYEIVQGLRAAALGLPFLPAPGVEGSDYGRVNGRPSARDPESGEEMPVARPIRPDVALIHAQGADRDGNLLISDLYAEDLLARASLGVVATAERIVARIERPTIPASLVQAVAEVRGGAFPTSCHGHYPYSAAHLREYLAAAASGSIAGYLERHVTGPAGQAAFLEGAGGPGAWDAAAPAPAAPVKAAGAAPGAATPPTAAGQPEGPSPVDRLLVGMARCIAEADVVATGVASALPMLAVALARATHAPRLTYINCVGAVDPRIERASPTSVDVRLLDRCAGMVTLPDLFDLARQGRIDLMFFGAAQVDAEARLNLTCIGDYARPKVKLPGPAGSSSMRPYVRKVVVAVQRQSARALVPRVDFVTSSASPANLETTVVTDLAILRLRAGRLRLVSRHAGVAAEELRARSGFPLEGDARATTPEPTRPEMAALRKLDPGGIRHGLA